MATGALLSGVKHLGHKCDYLVVPRVRVRGAIAPFSLHGVVLKQENPPVNVLLYLLLRLCVVGSVNSYKYNKDNNNKRQTVAPNIPLILQF